MEQRKTKNWRSKKYLNWVKAQSCYWCGDKAEPHHLKGIGCMSGVGLKAPDYMTMPLCRKCHIKIHNVPSLWQEQWEMIVRTLGKAIDEGFLK